MNMKKIFAIIATAATLFVTASCNWLEVTSESQTTLDSFFTTEADCYASTAPLYAKVWFDFNNNFSFGFMDGRANNVFAPWSDYIYPYVNLIETSSTANLYSAWQSLFVIVSQADNTLNNLDNALSYGVSESVISSCKAECRFMRGLAYWYLATCWGNVPIIEDPQTLVNDSMVYPNPTEDVLAFAIRDMEFAAENLPEKPYQTGRVTKWSAKGMLARFYNTAAAFVRGSRGTTGSLSLGAADYYAKAKSAAADVIENSGASLLPKYEDLFKVQNNDNEEVLFALQWVPNSDYGTTNFTDSYLAPSSIVVGGRSAWGNATYGSGDLIELFSSRTDLIRLAATYFTIGCYYDYIRSAEGGYLVGTGTGSYDANGDFVTVSAESLGDYAWIKKGVVGCSADTGGLATNQNSAWHNPMLRLADVMLHYCEACIGTNASTSDAQAVEYYNAIRKRAGLSAVSEVALDGDTGLWSERRCELALEGLAWADFVRRAYYQQEWVLDFMGKQNRNCAFSYDYETNVFKWSTNEETGEISKVGSKEEETPDAARLLLPYPESELVMNPLLKADPVPYTFND